MPERISRFTVPELANVPEDVRNRILAVQEKAGFVPLVCKQLPHPGEVAAQAGAARPAPHARNRSAHAFGTRPIR